MENWKTKGSMFDFRQYNCLKRMAYFFLAQFLSLWYSFPLVIDDGFRSIEMEINENSCVLHKPFNKNIFEHFMIVTEIFELNGKLKI